MMTIHIFITLANDAYTSKIKAFEVWHLKLCIVETFPLNVNFRFQSTTHTFDSSCIWTSFSFMRMEIGQKFLFNFILKMMENI